MDGIKLMIECAGDDEEQNCYYKGWTCDYVIAVLVFSLDGTIPICCYNVLDTVHESMVVIIGKIYDKLGAIIKSCYGRCIVDLALACNNYPFLIKSEKSSVVMTLGEIDLPAEATSMHQSAE